MIPFSVAITLPHSLWRQETGLGWPAVGFSPETIQSNPQLIVIRRST